MEGVEGRPKLFFKYLFLCTDQLFSQKPFAAGYPRILLHLSLCKVSHWEVAILTIQYLTSLVLGTPHIVHVY